MTVETVKSERSVRLQYPYTFAPDEIYCPRCDMYFESMSDYQDHLIIKQFKLPFLKGIRDVQKEREVLSLIEFADARDQKVMHWKEKSKRYYNQSQLLDEVLDVRDQCRVQRQRQLKGRTRKTFGHARNRSALTEFLKLHSKGTSLLGYWYLYCTATYFTLYLLNKYLRQITSVSESLEV